MDCGDFLAGSVTVGRKSKSESESVRCELGSSTSWPSGLRRIGAVLQSAWALGYVYERMRSKARRTESLQLFPEPVQSHDHYCDVDESKISDHSDQISIDLLVCRQFFQINPWQMRHILAIIEQESRQGIRTCSGLIPLRRSHRKSTRQWLRCCHTEAI